MEIGSEFHEDSTLKGKNTSFGVFNFGNMRFVQSGRTGLALIADELKLLQKVKTIALPAYCCSSMVYPFYGRGVSVIFYPVPTDFALSSQEDIDNAMAVIETADAVLVMDYFGFVREFAFQLSDKAKKLNKVVVVDATQSAFSKSKAYDVADYVLVSYRKWSDLLCATVYSKTEFASPLYDNSYDIFNSIWKTAAHIKRQYITGTGVGKSEYLELYQQANSLLGEKYENYSAPNDEVERLKQIDSDFLICKRRENAEYLIEALNHYQKEYDIKVLFNSLEDDDCPLFVPILVNEKKRDLIRKELICKEIFCPAHWPLDNKYPFCETSYHHAEISLLCDQRYNIDDMAREIDGLISALKKS